MHSHAQSERSAHRTVAEMALPDLAAARARLHGAPAAHSDQCCEALPAVCQGKPRTARARRRPCRLSRPGALAEKQTRWPPSQHLPQAATASCMKPYRAPGERLRASRGTRCPSRSWPGQRCRDQTRPMTRECLPLVALSQCSNADTMRQTPSGQAAIPFAASQAQVASPCPQRRPRAGRRTATGHFPGVHTRRSSRRCRMPSPPRSHRASAAVLTGPDHREPRGRFVRRAARALRHDRRAMPPHADRDPRGRP